MPPPALLRLIAVIQDGFRAVSLPGFSLKIAVVWAGDEGYG
jgi:hypothetical protein